MMKRVEVVCAVIKDNDKYFCCMRGPGRALAYKWEFPGGKVEPHESKEHALIREIKEELETEIMVGDLIDMIEYDYPTFHLSMDCFWCEALEGALKLLEAESARWLTKDTLYDVQWLPADIMLVDEIEKQME